MNGRKRPGAIWFRLAFGVAVAIAAHALHAGSASADTRAAAAGSAAAPGSSAVVLAGFTSQQYPVFAKVTADGRKLTIAAIALNMTCTSGAQFVLEDSFVRLPIGPGGMLHGSFSQPPTSGSNGDTFTATDSLKAKLGARHTQFSGVWQLSVHYSFTNGMSDQCDSGPVRFRATG